MCLIYNKGQSSDTTECVMCKKIDRCWNANPPDRLSLWNCIGEIFRTSVPGSAHLPSTS